MSRMAGHAKRCNLGRLWVWSPTCRSFEAAQESECRSTDRGREAKRKEEAKENRCPSDMKGVIRRLVNTEGTSEQYTELQCLRKGLDTDRKEAKQAKSCKSDESSFWRRA